MLLHLYDLPSCISDPFKTSVQYSNSKCKRKMNTKEEQDKKRTEQKTMCYNTSYF